MNTMVQSLCDGLCCPQCGEPETFVTDSRPAIEGTRRRRQCRRCNSRFTTYETTKDLSDLLAIAEVIQRLAARDRQIVTKIISMMGKQR